jgi:hypothetical protein
VSYWLVHMQTKFRRSPPAREPASQDLKARARASFKRREEHKIDAPKAMLEYRNAEQALRDRTAALRAERLARESAAKP